MIPTGGRTDVLVQWFSDDFVKANEKTFEKMTVGPGEVLVIIKNGKPSEMYTEASVKLAGKGFWAKLRERLKGVKNQVLMADLRPVAVTIPFSGYTMDRTHIGGVMNVTIRVSKDNLIRLMNLYTRDLVTDEKWGPMRGKVKEVTTEDIENMLSYDSSLTIDASVLSKIDSSQIRADLDTFNARVRNAIDSMTPVWANCGLAVDVVKADISDNAYEDAMRYRDELAKAQMVKDADFEAKAKEAELEADFNILLVKKAAEEELAKVVGDYDIRSFNLTKEMEEELAQVDHDSEVKRRELASALESAKTQADIDHINSLSDEDVRKRKADTDAYIRRTEIANEELVKNNDARRQIELMQAQTKIEVEQAYEDGKKNGKALAEKEAYDRGYSDGRADALDRYLDATTRPQYAAPPPYGYPPQGYGYPPQGYPPQGYPPQGGYDDRDRRRRDRRDRDEEEER